MVKTIHTSELRRAQSLNISVQQFFKFKVKASLTLTVCPLHHCQQKDRRHTNQRVPSNLPSHHSLRFVIHKPV